MDSKFQDLYDSIMKPGLLTEDSSGFERWVQQVDEELKRRTGRDLKDFGINPGDGNLKSTFTANWSPELWVTRHMEKYNINAIYKDSFFARETPKASI